MTVHASLREVVRRYHGLLALRPVDLNVCAGADSRTVAAPAFGAMTAWRWTSLRAASLETLGCVV